MRVSPFGREAAASALLGLASAGIGFAEPDPGPAAGEAIERIEVLGMRTGVLEADPTVSSDTIYFADFEAEQLQLDEILGLLPGVQVRRFGGAGERSELSIRGSTSAQVVVRVDGLRLDTAQSGTVDLSTLPADLFERVDVRRGGGAVLAGSGAIGGVVDLQPRQPKAQPVHSFRLAGASFDTWEGSLYSGGPFGNGSYTIGYSGMHTDGDFEFERPEFVIGGVATPFDPPTATRINNEAERHSTLATFRSPLADSLEVRVLDLASFTSRGEPGLDSGAGATAGQRTRAHSRNFRNAAQIVLDAAPEEPLGGSARIFHRYERNTFRDPIPLFPTGDPIDVRTDNSSLGGRAELHAETGMWSFGLLAQAGFEGSLDRLEATDQSDIDRSVLGGWLRGELSHPVFQTRVVPSMRIDATEGFNTRVLPAIGVVLDPTPWLRLRGHVEKAFRTPNLDELYFPDQGFARGNPNLRAERATVFDGGFELLFDHIGPLDSVHMRATGFLHEIDESIVWFPINPTTIQPQNTGSASEVGVEASVSAAWSHWVRASLNATWLDAEVDATGIDLPGRAPVEVSTRLEVGDVDIAKTAFTVQYVGEIPVNEGGTQRLPNRTTYDVSAAFNLASLPVVADWLSARLGDGPSERRIWLAFHGRNLSDVAVRDALFFPQPGRSLQFAIEGRL